MGIGVAFRLFLQIVSRRAPCEEKHFNPFPSSPTGLGGEKAAFIPRIRTLLSKCRTSFFRVFTSHFGQQCAQRLSCRRIKSGYVAKNDKLIFDIIDHRRGWPRITIQMPMAARGGFTYDEHPYGLLGLDLRSRRTLRQTRMLCRMHHIAVHCIIVHSIDRQKHIDDLVGKSEGIVEHNVKQQERNSKSASDGDASLRYGWIANLPEEHQSQGKNHQTAKSDNTEKQCSKLAKELSHFSHRACAYDHEPIAIQRHPIAKPRNSFDHFNRNKIDPQNLIRNARASPQNERWSGKKDSPL